MQIATAPTALLLDAVSFLASAGCLRGLRVTEPPPSTPGDGGFTSGLRFLRGAREVRTILATTATVNIGSSMVLALLILFFARTVDLAAGTIGLVLAAGAVGGLAGSVTAGRLSARIGIGRVFAVGTLLYTAPFCSCPWWAAAQGS